MPINKVIKQTPFESLVSAGSMHRLFFFFHYKITIRLLENEIQNKIKAENFLGICKDCSSRINQMFVAIKWKRVSNTQQNSAQNAEYKRLTFSEEN